MPKKKKIVVMPSTLKQDLEDLRTSARYLKRVRANLRKFLDQVGETHKVPTKLPV